MSEKKIEVTISLIDEITKNSQAVTQNLQSQLDRMDAAARNTKREYKSFGEVVNALFNEFRSGAGLEKGIGGMIAMGAGAAGATIAVTKLVDAISASVDTANQLNQASMALEFVTGSAEGASRELAFVREESQRLGTAFLDNAKSYGQIAAAAKGTNLEGRTTREIFIGISEAAAALKLNGDQTAGALNAISQMISKGTVQAEELRGQLGERLPGAFQIAARAMGVSTAELGKRMEQGQIIADEFLPKFAEELQKTYGDAAAKAAHQGRAEIQRFHNSITEFAAGTGEVAISVYGAIAGYFNQIASNGWKADASQRAMTDSTSSLADEQERLLSLARRMDASAAQRQEAERKNWQDQQKAKQKIAEEEEKQENERAEKRKRLAAELEEESNRRALAVLQLSKDARQKILDEEDRELRERGRRQDEELKRMSEARNRLAMVEAGDDRVAQLRVQQKKELALYAEGSEARTIIEEAQSKELKAVITAQNLDIASSYAQLGQQMISTIEGISGGDRFTRIIGETLRVVQAIMTMQKALEAAQAAQTATAAGSLLGPIGAGLGLAGAVLPMLFREDGGPIYGKRHSAGGTPVLAEDGEYVLSRQNVADMGGMDGVQSAIRGGGGRAVMVSVSVSAPLGVTINGSADSGAIKQIEASYARQAASIGRVFERAMDDRDPALMRALGAWKRM